MGFGKCVMRGGAQAAACVVGCLQWWQGGANWGREPADVLCAVHFQPRPPPPHPPPPLLTPFSLVGSKRTWPSPSWTMCCTRCRRTQGRSPSGCRAAAPAARCRALRSTWLPPWSASSRWVLVWLYFGPGLHIGNTFCPVRALDLATAVEASRAAPPNPLYSALQLPCIRWSNARQPHPPTHPPPPAMAGACSIVSPTLPSPAASSLIYLPTFPLTRYRTL